MNTKALLRMFSVSALALVTLAPVSAVAQTPKPSSQAVKQARDHFQRGADLFREGNYEAALVEFKRANEVAPNYRILYNIGQTYQEMQNYTGALDAFQRYLEQGGPKVDAERRAYVEEQIGKLRGRVAAVTVVTNVPGAEVLVDDTQVGTTPLSGPVLVSAGKRKITVSKPPAQPVEKFVEIAGGDSLKLNIKLLMPEQKASKPQEQKTVIIREQSEGMGTGFWVGLASTGVFAAGATVTGVMALSARSNLDAELDRFPTTASKIDDAHSKTKTLALTTDILAGAAIVSGALTIYFASTRPEPKDQTLPAAATNVSLRVGPTGMSLQGQF